MKTLCKLFSLNLIVVACLAILATCACNKNNDDDNGDGGLWNPDWLIGTWEGTTPSGITPWANTKIRIVFESYTLVEHDTLPQGRRKAYAYSGTYTWNADALGAWNQQFFSANYPIPDFNLILWDGLETVGGQTMNNVSLRIGDDSQTDPFHIINLDCGPMIDDSGSAPKSIDFYGDIEITTGNNFEEAVYPPNQGSMIRLTKK